MVAVELTAEELVADELDARDELDDRDELDGCDELNELDKSALLLELETAELELETVVAKEWLLARLAKLDADDTLLPEFDDKALLSSLEADTELFLLEIFSELFELPPPQAAIKTQGNINNKRNILRGVASLKPSKFFTPCNV